MKRRTIFYLVAISAFVLTFGLRIVRYLVRSFYESFDIIKFSALLVAVCALVIAWRNYRRAHNAIVRLVDFSVFNDHSKFDEGQLHRQLSLTIANLGIPLRNPEVALTGGEFTGWLTLPLQSFGDVPDTGQRILDKGMRATFTLNSLGINEAVRQQAIRMKHCKSLSAVLFANGFLIKQFPLRVSDKHRREILFARHWPFNRLPIGVKYLINERLRRRFPKSWDDGFKLRQFIRCLEDGNDESSLDDVSHAVDLRED